jgi:hypothetical protein
MKLTLDEVGRVLAVGRAEGGGTFGGLKGIPCPRTAVLGSAEAHGTVNNVFAKFQCVLDFGMLAGTALHPPLEAPGARVPNFFRGRNHFNFSL